MKKLLFVGALSLLVLAGCGDNSGYYDDCDEPMNPYDEGGGHYAGFEWAAQDGGGTCDGNSESFNEGCYEYYSQLDEYQTCINN